MVVDYRAIQCDGNLQMFDLGRPIEKLPVLVCFDLVIPANAGDRVTPRQECVADHVAPTGFADAFAFAAMHPDPGAIHEWAKEHGPAAFSLSHSQNVQVVVHKPLVDSIEMQIWRYDLIIIEQEYELGFCGVYCCIATNADAHIVLLEINHFAVFGGLGILSREPMFGQTVVNDDDLGLVELLSKRLDESMACPRPMNGFDAEGGRSHTTTVRIVQRQLGRGSKPTGLYQGTD